VNMCLYQSTNRLHQVAALSTSALCQAGSKWRLKHGLGKCGNEYGPLRDIPDWSYADGRKAPVGYCEKQRRERQRALAERAVTLISELKFAKEHYRTKKGV